MDSITIAKLINIYLLKNVIIIKFSLLLLLLNIYLIRFILYDVNPPEGFNLRRDVYMRYAVFAHELMNSNEANLKSFNLVLPPWSNMYHWKHKDIPEYLPWAHFFDLESLQKFAPVIEMYQFFNGLYFKQRRK